MELWWGEIERRKTEVLGVDLPLCHFVHIKFHVDPPGIRPFYQCIYLFKINIRKNSYYCPKHY
jgi:hypothetical protein